MNEFASRQRDIPPRSRPSNLPPRPGSGSLNRRDSSLSDRGDGDRGRDKDKDRDRERSRDARAPAYRQNSGFSPGKSVPGYPSSPKLSEGPTENGKAPSVRTQGSRASPPLTQMFSQHPELKTILDSLGLRSAQFNELSEALEIQRKAQNSLNKPIPADNYSEKGIFKLRLEQARDRSTKTAKKLEDIDKKLMTMIMSFLDKQTKPAQSADAFKAQMESLQKTAEASMTERLDKKLRELESSMASRLEEKMRDAEASLASRMVEQATTNDAVIAKKHTQKLKEQEENLAKRLSKKMEDQEALLMERLDKKVAGQDALLVERLGKKMKEQEKILLERLQTKMVEQDTLMEKLISQKMGIIETSVAARQEERFEEQRTAMARTAKEEAVGQNKTIATIIEQKMSVLNASLITPQVQKKLEAFEESLRTQQRRENSESLQRLNEQNAKLNTLSQSLESVRDKVDNASTATTGAKEQLSQLKATLDLVDPKKLQEEQVVQNQLIENLQRHRSQVDAQLREMKDVRPRFAESPPVGSSLSAEQLETRLLVQYKDLLGDIQKLGIRVEKLEQSPAHDGSFLSPNHKKEGARSMTDAQIMSLVNSEATSVTEAFKVKFEKATTYLESFLNTEIDARDDVIKPKVEKLLTDFAAVYEKLNVLEASSKEIGEVSRKARGDMQALKTQVDLLDSAHEEISRLKSETEDIANRIAHITEWQNNFNSASVVQDMTAIIQSMVPMSTQSQVNDLVGRVTGLEKYMRHMTDPDSPHKRRKVAVNGSAVIVQSS